MIDTVVRVALVGATVVTSMNGQVVVRRGVGYGASCYQPTVAVVPQPYVAQWHYSVGAERLGEERLRKVEEAIIVQQQLNAQLTRIVSNGGAGQISQSEIAVRRVFTQNCLKCHSGAQAKGGMDLAQESFNVFDKALISQMVGGGEMPPPESGIKLSKSDLETIQNWAGESADEFKESLRQLRHSAPPTNGNGKAPVPRPIPLPQ